jgi:hypothetical protein
VCHEPVAKARRGLCFARKGEIGDHYLPFFKDSAASVTARIEMARHFLALTGVERSESKSGKLCLDLVVRHRWEPT